MEEEQEGVGVGVEEEGLVHLLKEPKILVQLNWMQLVVFHMNTDSSERIGNTVYILTKSNS